MSKITFRADDELVDRLEACDASKSEVMREALRAHLDDGDSDERRAAADASDGAGVDAAIADRVDELIDAALDERVTARIDELIDARLGDRLARAPAPNRDVNVNVTLDAPGVEADSGRRGRASPEADHGERDQTSRGTDDADATERPTSTASAETACSGCGETVPSDHVYCPNCGEKQSHRAFCECGDEIRTDWAFCPGCGRRTPAADVLRD